jgi:hypothetical protein
LCLILVFFYQKECPMIKAVKYMDMDMTKVIKCPSTATQIRISFHCWLNSYIGILHDLPAHQNSQRQLIQSQYKKYITRRYMFQFVLNTITRPYDRNLSLTTDIRTITARTNCSLSDLSPTGHYAKLHIA